MIVERLFDTQPTLEAQIYIVATAAIDRPSRQVPLGQGILIIAAQVITIDVRAVVTAGRIGPP